MNEKWNSYPDMFCETVEKYPDRTAIIQGDRRVSYSELARASDVVAGALLEASVEMGRIVPIILKRSPEIFAALLGIWKAGAAGAIVNTAFPADRIEEICRQCGGTFVIDEAWIQNIDPFTQSAPPNLKLPCLEPEALAMVVFTSGSTGGPKGVMLPHRAVAYKAAIIRKYLLEDYNTTEKDILFSIVPFSSVIIMANELSSLVLGSAIDIVPDVLKQDMAQVIRYGLEHQITFLFIPPVLCPVFIKHFEGRVKVMFTGSERVSNIHSDGILLLNCYGATETSATVCIFKIDRPYDHTPIGKPLKGTNMYLLDSTGNIAAEGEIGELCISGESVALGYLHNSDLSAEKFVPNPFSDDPKHQTLYRTGDLARVDAEGNYVYIQRSDWMLKVAGNRVEPGEIEYAMCKTSPINKAVVVGFDSRAGEVAQTRLYACYTANEAIDPKKVQEELYKVLPDYMVPSFIEQVPSLPLNLNGKIDRSKIVPPEIEYFKADYEPPANDTEEQICESFMQVLHLPRVGALDNFILLGGDSISAARLAFLLYKSTGLSLTDILLHQTPRALAARANTKSKERDTDDIGAGIIKEAEAPLALELSPYQVTLVNEWMIDPGRYDYNIVEDNIFDGEISPEKLNNSLIRLFNEYFLFNCNVVIDNDVPYWKNRGPLSDDAQILQYFDHPIDDKTVFSLVSKPFDLENDPLFRYILVKLSDRQYRYIVCGHHLVIDGIKANAIHEEYANYYNDPDYGRVVNKNKQQMLFAGYLETLRIIMNENRKNMIDFWRGYCRDVEPADLKFLFRSPGAQGEESLSPVSICSFAMDKNYTDRVKIVSQKYGLTPYMYAKIIFALALYRMSGQNRISFSFPVAIPEGLALMFCSQINTLIITFSFDRDTTVNDLILQTREFYSAVEKNKARYLPINEILEFLREKKMPEINFAHSGQRYSKFGFNGVEKETVNRDFLFDLRYTLLIQMEEQSNQLLFEFKYKNKILDSELVLNFSKIYQRLFGDMLSSLLN